MIPSHISPQHVMQVNADTVKLWQEMAEGMAQSGGDEAQPARDFLAFLQVPEHRDLLWTFASTLNLVFGALAFQVPVDDPQMRTTFLELTAKHPELAWILEHERNLFDFQDINPDLQGEALAKAQQALTAWFSA